MRAKDAGIPLLHFPKREDGSGRPPKPTQVKVADYLEEVWDKANVHALQLPTGVGKSWLCRMVQENKGALVIVPSNILMDDTYTKVYPDVNALKGKTHYNCHTHTGLDCADASQLNDGKKACPGCPYGEARRRAIYGEPTFFNPMSLFYLQKDERYKRPDVIVIDEAHQLRDMLLLISGKQFRRSKYQFPETTNELEIIQWMQAQLRTLHKLFNRAIDDEVKDAKVIEELSREIESVANTLKGLEENSQNYAIYISDGTFRNKAERYLNVVPLEPPRFLVNALLDCNKLVLMSATLPRSDIETLIKGEPYTYLDMPSPIDKSRRTIYYNPTKFPMNFKTEPVNIVRHIERIIADHPGLNTIIHVSYGWAQRLAPHFTIPILTHTAENKAQALEVFKQRGGVFLASGFAEGVDLKGKLCELNIIPMIIKLNPYDPAVKKRMAWGNGRKWYDMEAIKTLVQQVGRSTRGETDRSKIVVCDPAFPTLLLNNKQDVPMSFYEAVDWRYKPGFEGGK